jgi:hypothetical protein
VLSTLAGGFGLAYAGRTASDIRSDIGARFDDVVAVQSDASLTLRARLAWIHDWVSDPRIEASFETLPRAGFNVVGAIPAKNAALLSGVAEQRSFPRIGGSIPLGALGGDRVILSNNLRDALINAGRTEPYRRTYAAAAERTPELFKPVR